jgi:dihydropyrimidinase
VGADADLIVLDPEKSKPLSAATQHQYTDFSVWEGMQVKGVVVHTLAGDRHVWADGDLRAEPGTGRYLPRQPFGLAYDGLLWTGHSYGIRVISSGPCRA